MSERHHFTIRSSVALCVLLTLGTHATAHQKPSASGGVTGTRKQITYGDVVINDFQKGAGSKGQGFHLSGPHTVITVPDKASRSLLVVHADDVQGTPVGKDPAGLIEMSGHLHYTLTQPTPGGTRTVTGIATHAVYHRNDRKIHLLNGVQAVLTDPERLHGPATLHSDSVTIDLSAAPYLYRLEGAAGANDLRFTTRGKASSAAGQDVHIFGFTNGVFQPGKTAGFHGGEITTEITHPTDRNQARLQSTDIETQFTPDGNNILEVRSPVPVRYTAQQRSPKGQVLQTLTGSANTARYLPLDQKIQLQGSVESALTYQGHLIGPGALRSQTALADLNATPYRYTVEGAPSNNAIRFTLSGPKSGKSHPVSVRIHSYETAVAEGNKSSVFLGPETTVEIDDPLKKLHSRMQSARIVLTLRPEDGTIQEIESSGRLTYHVEQTYRPVPSRAQDLMRTLEGVADNARIYFETTAGPKPMNRSRAVLHGVDARFTAPDSLDGPGLLRADTLTMLTSGPNTIYRVEGAEKTNDLRMVLLEPSSDPKKPVTRAVHLFNYRSGTLELNKSALAVGPNSTLVVDDPAVARHTQLQADQIGAQFTAAGNALAQATANGHVRYTLEQPDPSGKTRQSVQGTSGQALYVDADQRLTLSRGVDAMLNDPERLDGPARLHVDTATITRTGDEYRYVLEGAEATNDLRFTQKRPVESARKRPATHYEIHLYSFQTGVLQTGQTATAEGTNTTVDVDDPATRHTLHLQADRITGTFSPDGSSFTRAEANGHVRYQARQPEPAVQTLPAHSGVATITTQPASTGEKLQTIQQVAVGTQTTPTGEKFQTIQQVAVGTQTTPTGEKFQTIQGVADNAVWDDPEARLRLTGNVDAQITDPGHLDGPGLVHADTVTIDTSEPNYLYRIEGAPAANDLRFTLLQTPPPTPTVSAPKPVPVILHIYDFTSATYQLGMGVLLQGQKSTLDYTDPADQRHIHLLADYLSARFTANGNALSQAEVSGNTRFEIHQPSPTGKTIQSIIGSAAHAYYVADPVQQIDIEGPLSVDFTDPEQLMEPGHVTGQAGDVLHLKMTAKAIEYSGDSPKGTMPIAIRPRQAPAAQKSAQPAPQGATPTQKSTGKHKGKH